MKRSPILGYNHNVRYAGRLWHIQTEDSGVGNPRIFTHLFHEGTILATKRGDYDATLEIHQVQKLMQEQHKQLLRELKGGAFDEKIARFFGVPVVKDGSDPGPVVEAPPPELPPPTAPPVDFARAGTLLVGDAPSLIPTTDATPEALPGPMTDPSMPVVMHQVAEPADFNPDDETPEISIEAPPEPIAPEKSGPMPIPPVPQVPRSPSMTAMPRAGAVPPPSASQSMPRVSSVPGVTPPPTVPSPPSASQSMPRVSPLAAAPTPARSSSPVGGVPRQPSSPQRPAFTPPSRPNLTPTPTPTPQPPLSAKSSGVRPALTNPTPPPSRPAPPNATATSGRIPSGVHKPITAPPPGAPSDDPLSQIPIFAAAPPPAAPTAPNNPQRRDAQPLRVPTRNTAPIRTDAIPSAAPRQRPPTDPGVPRRQSQSHGVVKPTSEGVVVARPAVVIGGNAPPAAANRGVPTQRPLANNRWHQSGPPGSPAPGTGPQPPRGKGFGSDLISERSLDEVILAYLSEDAKDK